MTEREQAARGTVWLTLGNGTVYIASFVRNAILARVLSKADFGIAVTFGLVLTLFELTAKLGISRCVIQDKEGNEPGFQASAHSLQLAAGGVSALLILMAAPWLAAAFGIREHAWALMLLAAVALFRGLEHVDVRRYERELRFGPSAAVEAVPQIIITLVAWPVAVWLGDFRAVLWLLMAKTALSCGLSHLLAERPYRLAWEGARVQRMLRFGWPLLVTGFLMFGVLQGDQSVVATFYEMSDLGPYAAAAALALAPSFLFGGILSSLLLPLLSKVQDDCAALQRRYEQAVAMLTLVSATVSVGMVVGAEALMQLIYGPKYAGSGVILAWLSAAVAFRNLRIGPSAAALARGDSQNQMISNAWRVVALIPVLALAWQGAPVWTLACCGLVGEALAGWISLVRLRRRDGIPLAVTLRPTLWLAAWLVAAGGFYALIVRHVTLWGGLGLATIAALASGVACLAVLPSLRWECRQAWTGYRLAGWRGVLAQLKGEQPWAQSAAVR